MTVVRDLIRPAECSGESYEAVVPDTVDLAERARLGLNGVVGTSDPACYYQMWFAINYASREPYLSHNGADGTCTVKFAESLPLLRTASGSQEHLDVETNQMVELVKAISPDDGLYYVLWQPNRPWHSNYMPHSDGAAQEDFASVVGVGRMMRSMLVWQERDGDDRWNDRLRAMARGAAKMAVFKDDYAYYPDGGHSHQYAYPRSGWQNTREPASDTESGEGSVLDSIGHMIYGLARWYTASGDREAIDLAGKIATFATLPKMWGGLAEEIAVHGGEQGHFHSHMHGHMGGLRGILEYARATNDEARLEFVRRSYEHLRTYMIPRIGWLGGNGVGDGTIHAEGCNLADLIALGIRLSESGIADYWDDVDAVTRNLLLEQQLTDVDKLRSIAEASPPRGERSRLPGQETYDRMPERLVGIYAAFASPNSIPPSTVMGCCVANGTQAIYYAWEGALRCDGDTAQVNLLINRASRLVDVDSYLPYEGRVVVHNKAARRVSLRISNWIDRRALRLSVSGQERPLAWVGNYVVVDDLNPGDRIEVVFPVRETTASYTASHRVWRRERQFTYTFRGSTVVDVAPRETNPRAIPIYDRAHLRADSAPMKKVTRFVPSRPILRW